MTSRGIRFYLKQFIATHPNNDEEVEKQKSDRSEFLLAPFCLFDLIARLLYLN